MRLKRSPRNLDGVLGRVEAALRVALSGTLSKRPTFEDKTMRAAALVLVDLAALHAATPGSPEGRYLDDPLDLRDQAAGIRRCLGAIDSAAERRARESQASSLDARARELEAAFDWESIRALRSADFYTGVQASDDDRWNAVLSIRVAKTPPNPAQAIDIISRFSRGDLLHLALCGSEGRIAIEELAKRELDASALVRIREGERTARVLAEARVAVERALMIDSPLRLVPAKRKEDELATSHPRFGKTLTTIEGSPNIRSTAQLDQAADRIAKRVSLSTKEATVLSILAARPSNAGLSGGEIEQKLEAKRIHVSPGFVRNRVISRLRGAIQSLKNNRRLGGYLIADADKPLAKRLAKRFRAAK